MADADAIWNNLRARGRSESGYQLEGRPVASCACLSRAKKFSHNNGSSCGSQCSCYILHYRF